MTRLLLVLGMLLPAFPAQEGAAPAGAPRQDPEALELFDRADALVYSAVGAGLEELRYEHTLGHLPGVTFHVHWKAPDVVKIELEQDEGISAPIRTFLSENADRLQGYARDAVDMVVGKKTRATYRDDRVELAGKNRVRVVAVSPRSRETFREKVLTFDDKGLPVQLVSETVKGHIEMNVTYRQEAGRWFISEVQSTTPTGPATMKFEYEKHGSFHLPSRITTRAGSVHAVAEFTRYRFGALPKEKE